MKNLLGSATSARPGFGSNLPPVAARLLDEAVAARSHPNRADVILWSAQAMYPDCLAIYFALYKFYFYEGKLHEAERVTRLGLARAARLAGFAPDWYTLTPTSADWSDTRGPQHFYLFSLKALAFICLRLRRRPECQAILSKLAQLDPADSIGASVIRDLASGSLE